MSASPHIPESRPVDARHSPLQPGWKKCAYCGGSEYLDEIDIEFSRRMNPDVVESQTSETICKPCFREVCRYGCGIMSAYLNRGRFLKLKVAVMNFVFWLFFTPNVERSKTSTKEVAR
jgi:hypothetical protein